MIDRLVKVALAYIPELNEKRLREAFEFARNAHEGQERKDGSPYITHPWNAAMILTKMHVDEDTLIACLLHDVPEDTPHTLEEIGQLFGAKVMFLVDGITKLSKVHYQNDMATRQIESLKKLFIHSAQDPRVILIKLADRLHNMQTLESVSKPEKRERIARETLEIFVPVANLFGVWEVKNKLEDLCFKTLMPEQYHQISEMVDASEYKRQNILKKTIPMVEKLLDTKRIPFISVEGREKNVYSIYKKMQSSGKSFKDIYDLIGIRIIVDDIGACYQTLGIVHQAFRPKIGRLKDYIAIPKTNGYQSIHTTVFGVDGVLTEFQIRTHDMHLENEYGVAAHYFYTNAKKKNQLEKNEKKYAWVQQILDLQRSGSSNEHFLDYLKLDVFQDRIFVFTPKGYVVDLPVGSNVIDFAYHIHSDLGMLAVSAEVNGIPVGLTASLHSGDTVYIVTSEESDGPQVEWLSSVHTTLAKTRIREFLKEKDKTEVIQSAEVAVDFQLKVLGLMGIQVLNDLQKVSVMERYKAKTWEDLLYELGKGTIDFKDFFHALYTEDEMIGKKEAKHHDVQLHVEVNNRVGLLRDLTNVLAQMNVNIKSIASDIKKNGVVHLYFTLEIEDLNQYEKVMNALVQVDSVLKVVRAQNGFVEKLRSIGSRKKRAQQSLRSRRRASTK